MDRVIQSWIWVSESFGNRKNSIFKQAIKDAFSFSAFGSTAIALSEMRKKNIDYDEKIIKPLIEEAMNYRSLDEFEKDVEKKILDYETVDIGGTRVKWDDVNF